MTRFPHITIDRTSVARVRVRRGLATVEFVLWLPILLFVMALMVNYGTMAAWRIRGEIASHDAGWRTRWPRQGGGEPDPAPTTAVVTRTETTVNQAAMSHLDPAVLRMPVVRGPLPNGYQVRPLLDPLPGAVAGNTHVERQYPLLRKIGSFESGPINDPLLHGSRTHGEMGFPNYWRRVRELYALPQTDPNLPEAFRSAVLSVLSIKDYHGLYILDRSEDWIKYRGAAPDYHPRLNRHCTLDRSVMWNREVSRIVDVWNSRNVEWDLGEISKLPSRLTSSFHNMYQQVKNEYENELNADPPPPPARKQYLKAEIADLIVKLAQLEEFSTRIGKFEDSLRKRPADQP